MMEVNTEGLVRGVSYDTEPEKTYLILKILDLWTHLE